LPAEVTTRLLSNRRTARRAAECLVKAGLWEVVEGGYLIHDFLEYQPSSEKIKAKRAATRERVARFRNAVTPEVRNGVTERVTNAGRTLHPDPDPDPDPDPPTPVRRVSANGAAHPPGETGYDLAERCFFAAWCERYGEEYVHLETDTGPKGETHALMRIGRLALEKGGEPVMQHWAHAYLADNDPWLIEHRHPIRAFEKRLNKYGTKPATSEAPKEWKPPRVANAGPPPGVRGKGAAK
jgi:hypothetical protein